jgi:hypothetical protein
MDDLNLQERQTTEGCEMEVMSSLERKGHDSWEVDVYVYLHSDAPLDFSVESYLQSDSNSDNLMFYNRCHPGFYVYFHLIDETGKGYRFPQSSNKDDAIWSQMGTSCPTQAIYEVFDQNKINVKDQGATLKTFNPNEGTAVGNFQYTLNVSTDGKAPYLALDPGGTNMNGSTRSGASGGTG